MQKRAVATDPVPILQALVRCPSVTPEEGGALDYLQGELAALGFSCQRLKFEEVDNLFARIGTSGPHLCFAGHTDVVPPGRHEDWKHPPFSGTIEDGILHGRGAVDMKGSVAAFLAAAADAIRHAGGKPAGSLSLLITGDEEGPAINGTVKVLEWMKANGHVPDHCLVGEPSSDKAMGDTIKVGRRGSLSFAITCEGKQGHVAYPHKADNPVHRLAKLIDRIASARLDGGNTHFGPSTLSVTSFDVGNPTGNVIPARARALLNIRFNTEHSYQSLKDWMSAEAAAVGGNFSFTTSEGADAFITEPGAFVGLVQDAVAEETGLVPVLSTSGGTSDARFIKDYCPVLEFGPVNATIHQVDERIPVEELRATARIYRGVIDRYLGQAG